MNAAHPIKLLLVEDTLSDALLIKKTLQTLAPDAYTIQHVFTIAETLRALADGIYDVVLLDLNLPDAVEFSGLLAIQQMMPHVPVVILTGHNDEGMAIRGMEAGAQDYLFKSHNTGTDIRRAIQYAIKRKQLEGMLARKAHFDPLTGLANRHSFESRLDMALARSRRHPIHIGVFFMDLDCFKQVNDTMGHAAGDALLKGVAQRLRECMRPYDTAARFGGDEFAVLIEDVRGPNDCVAVANKIIDLVSEPFPVTGQLVEVGISIGVATTLGGPPQTRDSLIQRADAAMYSAKRAMGSNYQFHEEAVA
ncbi:MAG TPA: diguanylate cyclase [Rickettsiales bacterium]|nr:diguanylate cyclase [Rickettsiales bacterium]